MNSEAKIYNDNEVRVGTLLGGPLVGGYLIAKNYQVFGQNKARIYIWIYSIIITILAFGFAFLLEKIPNFVIPLAYTIITYAIYRRFQGEDVDSHISAGGLVQSWWNVIGVSILGLIITLTSVFSIAYLAGGFSDSTKYKNYGIVKHEIGFEKENISEIEVDKIADVLRNTNFFDDEQQKFVYVKKVGSNYEISIYCNVSIKDSLDGINWFTESRNEMQKSFPHNKIIFILVIDRLENIVKRIE